MVQGENMEQASLEEKPQGVVATTSGDPSPVAIRLTVQKANHDDKIAYKFSEANRIGMRYQRAVGKQTADSECWFSLYEIVKTEPSDMDTADYLQVRTYEFKSFEKAIEFVETMLKTCGYEFRRRTGYEDVVYHNPERMAHDMGYTLSLLLADNEWEASVMHYRKPVSHFKPRYLVTPDVPHTPQTKRANSQKLEQEASSGSDAEKKWQDSVRKKLEFASDDSSGSSPMVKAKMNDPTMNKFVRMAALGEISMSDLMRIITAFGEEPLKPSIATVNQLDATSKGSVKEKAKSMVELDSSSSDDESGYSSFEEAKRKSKRKTKQSKKVSKRKPGRVSSDDEDMDLSLSEESDSDEGSRRRLHRNVTTVIQNVSIKPFSGSKVSPEEAKTWVGKHFHAADISGWSKRQKRKSFVDALVGPAKQWEKQLPSKVRKSWKRLLKAFYKKYCLETTPATLTYYRLTQKTDETALEYFYRFNVAAIRAKIDFRVDEDDEDPHRTPTELKSHIQQYFDTLHDKAVQMQFRFNKYKSIDKLEERLMMYENTLGKPTLKKAAKKQVDDATDAPATVARVNEKRGKSVGLQGGQRDDANDGMGRCDHCGKAGHTKETCYQLQLCPYCGAKGHSVRFCRALSEKLAEIAVSHPKIIAGELTLDDLVKEMTRSNQ